MASTSKQNDPMMAGSSSSKTDATPPAGKAATKRKRADGAAAAAAATTAAATPPAKPKKVTKRTATKKEEKEINRLLIKAGIEKPEKKSKCVRAGLARGHFGFKFTGEAGQLDTVVKQSKCDYCETGNLKATVRELLEQADYGGDYEDGSEGAAIECDNKDCGSRWYLTRCCLYSDMEWDCGKFHNHCTECKNLGICIGDYREAHCDRCSGHYFSGLSGFPCGCAKRSKMKKMAAMGPLGLLSAFLLAAGGEDDSDSDDYGGYF